MCPEVTLVTFSSNLSNFERKPQKTRFYFFYPINLKKKLKNPKKSKKNLKKKKKSQLEENKYYFFSILQKLPKNQKMSKMDEEIQKSGKNIENLRNSLKKVFFFLCREKKCYLQSFPIFGGQDSTRALQSSPFQNPGGGGSPEPEGG